MPLRVEIERVNAYLLWKQHLVPRARDVSVSQVVRAVGPLRAAPAIVPYIALWARLERFRREDLDRALLHERSLVRAPCMHAELYVLPAAEYPDYYLATRAVTERAWLGFLDDLVSEADTDGGDSPGSVALAQRVLEVLSARGPCTVGELTSLLPELDRRIAHDPAAPELGQWRLGARLIPAMCAEGLLVRTETRGSWRSDLYGYDALSSWLPDVDLAGTTPEAALQHVVRAYLAAYGPASLSDIVHWLGGVRRRTVLAALRALGRELIRVQPIGTQSEQVMLRKQFLDLVECDPPEHSAVLLPPRDSYVTAYSDPSRFLAPEYRDRVFDRAGEPMGTIWVGGRIAGTWSLVVRDERIVARFFEPADPETLALVGEEARRLRGFEDLADYALDIGTDEEASQDDEALAVLIGQGRPL